MQCTLLLSMNILCCKEHYFVLIDELLCKVHIVLCKRKLMKLTIRTTDDSKTVEVDAGTTVLKAIQLSGTPIEAPCGGQGICKKCRVMIHDNEGVSFQLACQAEAQDGMEVVVSQRGNMVVSESGEPVAMPWKRDRSGYGVAIDVGTTTVVCRLYEMATGRIIGSAGTPNPQITFGADVLARITACAEGALPMLHDTVSNELVTLIKALLRSADLKASDVTQVVLSGNTVMEHLAAGIDPAPLGCAPFIPPTLFGEMVFMQDFADAGLCAGKTLFASCIAAYVGGDITCDMLALDMRHSKELVLMIDLGTNGEMALGNAEGIISCATAAGPVFEGACIKYGMPAYEGAISRVWFEEGTLQYSTIGDADPLGICGTGLIDAIALMLDRGLIDETGAILEPDEIDLAVSGGLEKHLIQDEGQPALHIAAGISVTQKDVRQLQLAKAAISAGVKTMIHDRGVDLDAIDALVIAGGFGSFLDLRNASRVGLFSAELLDRASSAGNLAIEGAGMMCLSSEACDEAKATADFCQYIELSTSAAFNSFYVEEMGFEENSEA